VIARTAHVGSLPKPYAVRRARARYDAGEIDADALDAVLSEARAAALRLQDEVGLDEWTDGHFDRGDLVAGFALALDGVEAAGPVRVLDHHYAVRPLVTGSLARSRPVTVDGWHAASAVAARPVRATLPSPYTLAVGCLDEHHPRRSDAVRAFAEILADEVRDLVAAGATVVQIDEIAAGARDDETDLACEALARVADAAGDGCRVWVRLAYVDVARVAADVAACGVDGLAVPCPEPGDPFADWLRRSSPDLEIGLSVVRGDDARTEPVEPIVERVLAVASGRERVWLHPDAGLSGRTDDEARAKLRAVVEAARRLGAAPAR